MERRALSWQGYRDMKADDKQRTADLSPALNRFTAEREELKNGVDNEHPTLVAFMRYQNIDALSCDILIELVDHTKVYETGKIKVRFKCADELRRTAEYIKINTDTPR